MMTGTLILYDPFNIMIYVHPRVYPPSEDTFLMLESVLKDLEKSHYSKILEIGCGSGLISVVLAKLGKQVTVIDIDPYAIKCTLLNAYINGVRQRIRVLLGDLFSPLHKGNLFDLIVFNAPYMPPKHNFIDLRVEGGLDLIKRFLKGASTFLSDRGKIFLSSSSCTPISAVIDTIKDFNFRYEVMSTSHSFMEKIFVLKIFR